MKKLNYMAFTKFLKSIGIDIKIYGWEGILNLLALSFMYRHLRFKDHKDPKYQELSKKWLSRYNATYDYLNSLGYFDDIRKDG